MNDTLETKIKRGIDTPTDFVERTDGVEMRHKVNKVQKALRVQQIVTWLLEGFTYTEVTRMGQEKWGVSYRTVERYIATAREQVEAESASEVQSAVTLALYRLTELYFAAVEDGDLKTALDVVKTQNRMLGLNAPDKIEARAVADWNSMSVAEQLEHVGNILDRAAKPAQIKETN